MLRSQGRSNLFLLYTILGITFRFPEPTHIEREKLEHNPAYKGLKPIKTLRDAIGDLPPAVPALEKNRSNGQKLRFPNHEYMVGGFSSRFMSRCRRRSWDEPFFTIQAGGRHAPLHPDSAPMVKVGKDRWIFDLSSGRSYRRLSVKECARIQTFPDNFIFIYDSVVDGYKMVGNAVPVLLARVLAEKIKQDIENLENVFVNARSRAI